MLITNGTCVSRIVKSSAGSSGSRRRHDSLADASDRRPVARRPRPTSWRSWHQRCLVIRQPPTCEAMSWQFSARRRSTTGRRSPPRTAACTGCRRPGTPGSRRTGRPAGRAAWSCPGCRSARRTSPRSVGSANAAAAFLYCGDLVGRVAGARRDRRPSAGDLRAGLLDVVGAGRPGDVLPGEVLLARRCGIASAHDHSQPDASVCSTGAGA